MTRAGIADIGDRRVSKCSGGQQQRLRFAMALLSDPELLILDEPTTGMDVEGGATSGRRSAQTPTRGRTILFATHYLEEADEYADRIILVRQGKIVADGTAAQIKAMAAGRTVRARSRRDRGPARGGPRRRPVELRGDSVLVHSKDSDAVARYLLTQTACPRPRDRVARHRGRIHRPDRPTTPRRHGHGPSRRPHDHAVSAPHRSPARTRAAHRRAQHRPCSRIELRRLLRNRRTMIFTLVMPAVFYLIFGDPRATRPERGQRERRGLHHDRMAAVRRDDRVDGRRGDGVHRAGVRAGAGSCGSPPLPRWSTSSSSCSSR